MFLGFLVVFEGSELFRKVREGAGIHFHQVSSKSDPGRPSYGQKCIVLNVLGPFFLFSGLWTPDFFIFDLKIGFLVKNCIYPQIWWKNSPNHRGIFFRLRSVSFFLFWSLLRALSCLERSGRTLGFISTWSRPNPSMGYRVMTQNLRNNKDYSENLRKIYENLLCSSNSRNLDMPSCLCMQFFTRNPIFRSKNNNSDAQKRKTKKTPPGPPKPPERLRIN